MEVVVKHVMSCVVTHGIRGRSRLETLEIDMSAFEALPALISIPKAAEILGLSRASAYRFAASGDLPTRRLGGRVYVITHKLREFINGDGEAA